ncbi:MAG: rod shape-determining protein MreC [Bacilli bacterium]|nr:rod shape-determining protein MreC [Bacilli bacterium]
MKKMRWYYFLFFLFLFLLFGLEYAKRFMIQEDSLLKEHFIYEYDYLQLKKEYEELKNLHELPFQSEDSFISSKVLFKDPYHFYEEMTILKGRNQGLQEGDVVVNEKGYVGKIKKVDDSSSLVELLYHPQTQMAVTIEDSYGILSIENHQIFVKKITSKVPIAVGSVVRTSKYSRVPAEVPIGEVKEVISSSTEQVLLIEPYVDFEHLNYVSIRKGMNL